MLSRLFIVSASLSGRTFQIVIAVWAALESDIFMFMRVILCLGALFMKKISRRV